MSEPTTIDEEMFDGSVLAKSEDSPSESHQPMDEDSTGTGAAAAAADNDDVEVEDEVDELADDDEEDVDAPTKDSGAKTANAVPKKPPSDRSPGTSLIPASRITKIMKADKELGITAKEAIFLVSIATEEFIKLLSSEGHKVAASNGRSIVTQKDLATAVKKNEELLFLKDIIPLPIALSTALQKRKARAEGAPLDAEDQPANGSSSRAAPTPSSSNTGLNTPAGSVVVGAMDSFVERKPSLVGAGASRKPQQPIQPRPASARIASHNLNQAHGHAHAHGHGHGGHGHGHSPLNPAHIHPPEGMMNGQHTFSSTSSPIPPLPMPYTNPHTPTTSSPLATPIQPDSNTNAFIDPSLMDPSNRPSPTTTTMHAPSYFGTGQVDYSRPPGFVPTPIPIPMPIPGANGLGGLGRGSSAGALSSPIASGTPQPLHHFVYTPPSAASTATAATAATTAGGGAAGRGRGTAGAVPARGRPSASASASTPASAASTTTPTRTSGRTSIPSARRAAAQAQAQAQSQAQSAQTQTQTKKDEDIPASASASASVTPAATVSATSSLSAKSSSEPEAEVETNGEGSAGAGEEGDGNEMDVS